MIPWEYRRVLILVLLGLGLVGGVAYDMQLWQVYSQLQMPTALAVLGCFFTVFLLQRYPTRMLQEVFLRTWPLHLFTLSFLWLCIFVHGRGKLDQVAVYSVFAYTFYALIPAICYWDREIFRMFVKWVALLSALLAIPSFFGALGMSSIGFIPLRIKPAYSSFSGIIASGGVFEHAEGHAFQMGIGIICAWYLMRSTRKPLYAVCLALSLLGLIISQGRAAIYGLGIAGTFMVLPVFFRRSRPAFFATLFFLLTFPFAIQSQLADIPGVSSYLRVERGLSGREEAWRFAWSVIQRRPWRGYGFMAAAELTEAEHKALRKSGFSGAGTTFHNTFVTKAVDLGVIATALYALLYLAPLWLICRDEGHPVEEQLIRNLMLLTITVSLFRDYNIGGIRSTAMLGAIALGLANLWPLAHRWHGENGAATAAARQPAKNSLPSGTAVESSAIG